MMAGALFVDEGECSLHLSVVSSCSVYLARVAGLQPVDIEALGVAAPFHDIGKAALPNCTLVKKGPLTATERTIVEMHTIVGAAMLGHPSDPALQLAKLVALTHHERWDGTGYPYGLKADAIPMASRILAVADQYEALRSRRSYKPPLPHDRVCEILLRGDGRTSPEHFDPCILAVFRRYHESFAAIYDRSLRRFTKISAIALPAPIPETAVRLF